MNILILSTHFNTGGIVSYILTLVKQYVEQGHRVYVATSGGDKVQDLISIGAIHVTLNIRTKSELDLRIYWAVGPLIRLVKHEKIDVIHSQTRVTQVIGQLLSRYSGKPFIVTCHGFFKKRLSRKIFPCWGDYTIAISDAVKDHLINDFEVNSKKVVLIRNGLDVYDYPVVDDRVKEEKRRELALPNNQVLIGIVARLSDVKGHDILIKAMQKIVQKNSQTRLLIIGKGPMESKLKDMVKKLGLQEHIHFFPTVQKKRGILSCLDIFVMPSLQEGLGLSVMEAQASGLPVVASKVGGIPSLINDGVTGLLVPPKNIDALAHAIDFFMNNKIQAKQIGQRARSFIEKEFSAKKMGKDTLNLYERSLV